VTFLDADIETQYLMTISPDSLTDWIHLFFAVIAGVYALYLYRQSRREKRNQFILDLLDRIHNDDEVRKIIYSVDRGEHLHEIKHRGQLEKEADKTIQYFDYIGFLIKEGNINAADIKPFSYEIRRVLTNRSVKEYIDWLRGIGVPLDNLDYLTENKF
jgi:hypothetical protein